MQASQEASIIPNLRPVWSCKSALLQMWSKGNSMCSTTACRVACIVCNICMSCTDMQCHLATSIATKFMLDLLLKDLGQVPLQKLPKVIAVHRWLLLSTFPCPVLASGNFVATSNQMMLAPAQCSKAFFELLKQSAACY